MWRGALPEARSAKVNGAIKSRVIEKLDSLPEHLQREVLAFVEALQTLERPGVPGKQLLDFAGVVSSQDAALIQQAIDDGCEQVDANEW